MIFSSFVCRFSRTLFFISSWKTGISRAARSSQDWGHEKEHLLGFPSVTFYLKVIYSVMPLYLRIWNAFWPFQDCYLLCLVFVQCFYCLKLPCRKIYNYAFLQIKHPYFTRDLGPLLPTSRRLHSSDPGLQRPWQLCLQFPQIRVTLL